MKNQVRGITLIALVITIIVLLILAGISIAMLTGENGILTKADAAKRETQRADIIERAKLAILAYETENEGKITDKEAKEIIATYDKDYKKDNEFTFKKKDEEEYILTQEGYEILVREIWISREGETINFTIDGKALVAKKNEVWDDWLVRMKDEPREKVGEFVYYGWKLSRNDFSGGHKTVSFLDITSIEYGLYNKNTQEIVQKNMVIEPERTILFCRG